MWEAYTSDLLAVNLFSLLAGGRRAKSAAFATRRPRISQILDLFGEDSWRNVYAGELDVRPPGAPTTRSRDHQGNGLFTQGLVSTCEALTGGYGIFRARASDLEQERR